MAMSESGNFQDSSRRWEQFPSLKVGDRSFPHFKPPKPEHKGKTQPCHKCLKDVGQPIMIDAKP